MATAAVIGPRGFFDRFYQGAGKIDKEKYLTLASHGLSALGGIGLFAVSFGSSWGALAKMTTGLANFARNCWQIFNFSHTRPENLAAAQVGSNVLSSVTNLPQLIGGILTGKWADIAAPSLVSSMYVFRARMYWEKARGEIYELEKTHPLTGKLTRTFGEAAGKAASFIYKHKEVIPGVIMTARGVIQGLQNPWVGAPLAAAGLLTLYVDLH